jgi:hypothetical protein
MFLIAIGVAVVVTIVGVRAFIQWDTRWKSLGFASRIETRADATLYRDGDVYFATTAHHETILIFSKERLVGRPNPVIWADLGPVVIVWRSRYWIVQLGDPIKGIEGESWVFTDHGVDIELLYPEPLHLHFDIEP